MKAYIFRIFSLTFLLGFAFNAFAQPEPYPIDRTFDQIFYPAIRTDFIPDREILSSGYEEFSYLFERLFRGLTVDLK